MLYRPNFCCNCGEKIERAEWSVFSSRKFCDLCQTEYRAKELGTKFLVGAGIVLAAALVSSVFRPLQAGIKATSPDQVTLSSEIKPRADVNFNTTQVSQPQSQTGTNANTSVNTPSISRTNQGPAENTTEAVYYCGAATKKGTPCSRRVRRPGERCWQHQGMPSMADEGRTAQK